jgi:DNA-binding CsgD family transcriptional regulator
VATQNWCDLGAAALLNLVPSGFATFLLGQVDEAGHILRQESIGAAGTYVAHVTTTVGRTHAATATVSIDATDPVLMALREGLAQARELGWAPGAYEAGMTRSGPLESFGPGGPGTFVRRWEAAAPGTVLVGVAGLPGAAGRAVIVEIGLKAGAALGVEPAMLESVLPVLARRVLMAIGPVPIDSSQWLTARELAILHRLLLGKSVRDIAAEFERSPHTIHDHVKSLHRKLNARSRGELAARSLGYRPESPTGADAIGSPELLSRTEA